MEGKLGRVGKKPKSQQDKQLSEKGCIGHQDSHLDLFDLVHLRQIYLIEPILSGFCRLLVLMRSL